MYPYLQLLRLPTVFTAMADIFLGFSLTHGGLQPWPRFVALLASSCGLYLAGMVFNDVFDVRQDTLERPGRPIPSGRVSLRAAILLGTVLMSAGVILAGFVSLLSLGVALLLVAAILGYDGVLKHTPAGPLAMGSCRFLNVMLGASGLAAGGLTTAAWEGFWTRPQLACAAGLGIYIVGVTLFARTEARPSNRGALLRAQAVMNCGLAVLIWLLLTWPGAVPSLVPLLLMAFAIITINRHAIAAVRDPMPQRVQMAIKMSLLSLIMLDAAMILWHTGNSLLALGTASLVIPAMTLSRWIRMT